MSRIETMNRRGIRDHVWGVADWKPKNSPRAVSILNGFINRALLELAKDVPFLFDEALIQTPVYKDVTPKVTTDTFETTSDPWVLRMTLLSTDPNATPWEEDVDWDGRQIHLKAPDDLQWQLFTIREAWVDSGTNVRYITLTQPYPGGAGITDIDWKIYAHVLRLPADVIRVKACHMLRDGISYPLDFEFQGSAEAFASIRPGQLLPTGPPRKLFRRPPARLSAPAYTPNITTDVIGVWVGERPAGKFEYCVTYVWGRGEQWDNSGGPSQNAATSIENSRNVPWIESPPSEISAVADVEAGGVVTLSLPNITKMLGFDDAGTLRYNRPGLRKRIYVRRLSDPSNTVEVRERFYLLSEVPGNVTSFTDNGSVLPDLGAALQDNHQFQHLEMYPPPDQRYDMMLRVTLAPPRLETDTDAPRLPEVAMEALLTRTLMFLYESMGNASMKANTAYEYSAALQNIRKNYGLGKPSNVPRQRQPARVRGRRYTRRYIYSEDPIS
jgi:hypothetical protein